MQSQLRRRYVPPVRLATALLVALALAVSPRTAAGQEGHEHADGEAHDHAAHDHAGLHFTHPMIAESVTPDTKVRLDHQYFDFADGNTENSGVLEAEYAFHRGISLEFGLPYSYSSGEFGNLKALLKFANYGFEDSGVLLGYGLGVSVPTNGNPGPAPAEVPDHGGEGLLALRPSTAPSPPQPRFHGAAQGVEATLGTQEWELEPYLNVGFRGGPWELTGWTRFAVPFRHAEQHDVGTEFRWNFSTLFHASSRLQALLELDGSSGVSGHPVGEDVAFASPGLRVKPFPDQPLWIGSAVGLPMIDGVSDEPFDVRWKTSMFWHFPM